MTTLSTEEPRVIPGFENDVRADCSSCGESIPWSSKLLETYGPNSATCDSCCGKIDRARREKSKEVDFEARVKDVIPPLYQLTDPDRLPYGQRQSVLGWVHRPQSKEKTKGLWIVGDTRTGKTRTLCLLLAKLIREGKSVRAFFHGSFGDQLVEVLRSERSFRTWKREITTADVLAIDDLFSNKMTERVEASVFEILDERIANFRPTFVTTQLTKRDATSRFHSLKRCEAFFARVKEFFVVVQTSKPDDQSQFKLAS